jgi:UPF0288 family protein (methanogenesis marker protein 3)
MRIKSKWGSGAYAGKVVAVVDGKRVFVHLGSTLETPALDDAASHQSQNVLTVLIDNAKKAADHMSEAFIHMNSGDVVLLLCASEESRMAALAVLGL